MKTKQSDFATSTKSEKKGGMPIIHLSVRGVTIAAETEEDLIKLSRAAMSASGIEYTEVDAKERTYSSSMERTPEHGKLAQSIRTVCNNEGEYSNILYATYSSNKSYHVVPVFVGNDGNNKVAYFTSDIDTRIAYKIQRALGDDCKVVMPAYKIQADDFSCGMFAVAQLAEESHRFKSDPRTALNRILSGSQTVEHAYAGLVGDEPGGDSKKVEWDTGSIYSAKSDTKKKLRVRLDKDPEVVKYSQLSKNQPRSEEVVDKNTGQTMESFVRGNFLVTEYNGQFRAQNIWATLRIVDMFCRGDINVTIGFQKEMEKAMLIVKEKGNPTKVNPSLRNAITLSDALYKKKEGALPQIEMQELEQYRDIFIDKIRLDIQEGIITQEEVSRQARLISETKKDPKISQAVDSILKSIKQNLTPNPKTFHRGRSLQGLKFEVKPRGDFLETSSSSSDNEDSEVASYFSELHVSPASKLSSSFKSSSSSLTSPSPLLSPVAVLDEGTSRSSLQSLTGVASSLISSANTSSHGDSLEHQKFSSLSSLDTKTSVHHSSSSGRKSGILKAIQKKPSSPHEVGDLSDRSLDSLTHEAPLNQYENIFEKSPRAEFFEDLRNRRSLPATPYYSHSVGEKSLFVRGGAGVTLDRVPSYEFMHSAAPEIILDKDMNFGLRRFMSHVSGSTVKGVPSSVGGFIGWNKSSGNANFPTPSLKFEDNRLRIQRMRKYLPTVVTEMEQYFSQETDHKESSGNAVETVNYFSGEGSGARQDVHVARIGDDVMQSEGDYKTEDKAIKETTKDSVLMAPPRQQFVPHAKKSKDLLFDTNASRSISAKIVRALDKRQQRSLPTVSSYRERVVSTGQQSNIDALSPYQFSSYSGLPPHIHEAKVGESGAISVPSVFSHSQKLAEERAKNVQPRGEKRKAEPNTEKESNKKGYFPTH